MSAKLALVPEQPTERTFGSRSFISITRNPALQPPVRFEPTKKNEGDVVL